MLKMFGGGGIGPFLDPQFTSMYTSAAQYSIWIANVWLYMFPEIENIHEYFVV
jgi:hypothetical protein